MWIVDLTELHYEPIQSRVLRHFDRDAACDSARFNKLPEVLFEEGCIEETLEPRKRDNDVPLHLKIRYLRKTLQRYTPSSF